MKKILKNTAWLFLDSIFRQGLNLVILIWMARVLGPELFGAYNYALAFLALFAIVAAFGLDSIVIREIVKRPEDRSTILGSAFIIKLFISIIVFILLLIGLPLFQNTNSPPYMFFVLALSLFFKPAEVADFFYQSQVEARYGVYARNFAAWISSLFRILLLLIKAPLIYYAWAYTFEILLTGIFMLWIFKFTGNSVRDWSWSKAEGIRLLKDSWPLMFAGLAVTIYMRMDQIMIGKMMAEREVGIYSAALRISEAWYVFPMAFVSSVVPGIIKLKHKSEQSFLEHLRLLYEGLFIASLIVAIGFTLVGHTLVVLIYGNNYAAGGKVLMIHGWTGILVSLGIASSSYLTAENFTRISLYRTLISSIVNLFLNLAFIPQFGIYGAAYATLISQFIAVFSVVFFRKTRLQSYYLFLAIFPFTIGKRLNSWILRSK